MDRARAVRLRFIHIRSVGANLLERCLAVSGLDKIGEGLTECRCNRSRHTENGENQTLHVVSPKQHSGPACRGVPSNPWPRHTETCMDLSIPARGLSIRRPAACL